MGVAFAAVVGVVVSIGFCGPTVIFWRHQVIDSWKEVFGLVPHGTVPQTVPPSPVTRFRRSKKLVVFQSVVAILTALAATGAHDALAAILLLLVSFVTCVSLGLSFLAWGVENAQTSEVS
jgi:hypothetical protein